MARQTPWLVLALMFWWALPTDAQNKNVTVDDQPTAEQRLGQVKELHRAGRNDQAAELMQELIEGSRFKLVGLGNGDYSDAERWCRRTLFTNGPLREAYRTRFSAAASHALEQAIASDQPIEQLLEVYRLYTVTPSGFEAGMRLVGLLLESGEAVSAASLIEELRDHPDQKDHRARLAMLRGAAAAYTHDTDLHELCVELLSDMGEADKSVWLKTLARSVKTEARAIRPAFADAGPKPQTLEQSLWRQPIAGTDDADAWVMRDVFTLPRVTESLAMINNGRQVVAFDRASGQRAWAYPPDDDEQVTRTKFGQRWYDARSVAYGSGIACAVLGECYGIAETRNPYVLPNRLVCIDPQTGQARWQRVSGDIAENEPLLDQDRRAGRVNLQHTHFAGTPVITRDRMLVLLRRTSTQRMQSTWLMCFDNETGSLLWYRHLSLLSLNSSRESNKNTPQITLDGETAYISDGIATVAAVDVHSGGYRWLRILPVGYGSTQQLTIKARGVLSPPVMTRAGLLVSLSLHREPMLLLDPDDGSVLQDYDEHPVLSDARYILEAEGGAVVVTYDSVSFWDAREAEVEWTFRLEPDEYTIGRGDASKRFIVIPTVRRLVVLDRATGKLIDQLRPPSGNDQATNLIIRDGELFTVHDEKLALYATWDNVFGRLVKRVKDSPGDPSGGIALASLALKQEGMSDEVLQGVGYALRAIDLQPRGRAALIRSRVFDQLRGLTPLAKQSDLQSQLLDRMALVSETPAQEVAYHLDNGLFFAKRGEAERAIEHFHAVLSEPAFVAEPYRTPEGVDRPGGEFAKQQIEALILRYGRGVYARQDAISRAWLDEAKAKGTLDSAALINIARRFPLSLGTVEVLLDAASQNQARGKTLQALSLYQQAVVRAVDPGIRARAIGMLLAFYLANDSHNQAIELINREAARDATVHPIDPASGKPIKLEDWRGRVEKARPQSESWPGLGSTLSKPILLPGRLVSDAGQGARANSKSRLYLHQEDGTLACYIDVKTKKPAWSMALPELNGALQLLADEPLQALFWSSADAKLIAIDPSDGRLQWQMRVPLSGMEVEDQQGVALDQFFNQQSFMYAVSGAVVCVGHRESAEVVALDRATGGVLWQTTLGFNRLSAIEADDWTVYAAGPAGHVHQVRSGRLIGMDLFTGERVFPTNTQALALTPRAIHLHNGRVILTGVSGVVEVQPTTGTSLWLRRIRGATLATNSAIVGESIVLTGSNAMAYVLDLSNAGQITEQVLMRSTDQPDDIAVHADADLAVVRGGLGLVAVGPNASYAWRRPANDAGHPAHMLMGSKHIAVFTRQPVPGQIGLGWSLKLIDHDAGRLIRRYELDKPDGGLNPEHAERIGNLLAIPAGGQTMVLRSGT